MKNVVIHTKGLWLTYNVENTNNAFHVLERQSFPKNVCEDSKY